MRDKTEDSDEILSALTDIMASLSNLQILTFSVKGQGYDIRKPLPPTTLRSLSCRDTLKAIHWYNDHLHPAVGDWTLFLETHPHLESIRGRFLLAPGSHVKLESLKTIYQCSHPKTPQNLQDFDLTSVRQAVYHIGITLDPASTFNHSFFSAVGSQLSIIQIDCLEGAYLEDFHQAFSEIEQKCHNLSEIHFNLCAWSVFNSCIPGSRFPPSVKGLGIRVTGTTISNVDIRTLFTQTLPAVLSSNTHVKTVQIMNQGTIRALQGHPRALARGIDQVASLGVRLLTYDGSTLLERFVVDFPSSRKCTNLAMSSDKFVRFCAFQAVSEILQMAANTFSPAWMKMAVVDAGSSVLDSWMIEFITPSALLRYSAYSPAIQAQGPSTPTPPLPLGGK